jgi:hypothetical protein
MPMQLPAAASSELCASVLVGSILSVPSDEAKADAEWMQASIRHQINQRNFSKAEAQQFWKHMHFATASVAEVGHWIPGLLRQWTSPRKIVSVTSQQGTAEMPVQNCPVQQGTAEMPVQKCPVQQGTAEIPLQTCPVQLSCQHTGTAVLQSHILLSYSSSAELQLSC